jgi:hypothetical protein
MEKRKTTQNSCSVSLPLLPVLSSFVPAIEHPYAIPLGENEPNDVKPLNYFQIRPTISLGTFLCIKRVGEEDENTSVTK